MVSVPQYIKKNMYERDGLFGVELTVKHPTDKPPEISQAELALGWTIGHIYVEDLCYYMGFSIRAWFHWPAHADDTDTKPLLNLM